MIDSPAVIMQPSFQSAWIEAAKLLCAEHWERHNLVVNIQDTTAFNEDTHGRVRSFAEANGLLTPKQVAYTIFPYRLYKGPGTSSYLFRAYNARRGLYERTRRYPRSGWGTYFRRMTHYEIDGRIENQLSNIVQAIQCRRNTWKAAYTIVIQRPGGETVRTLGAPCMNYLAVQMERGRPRKIGLLCVYRNQDFLERAYGNYWGLCHLLRFLCAETASCPGPVTCVSSRAYVDRRKTKFWKFLATLQ